MENADYVTAYRFGFGLNASRGERFDPKAELGRKLGDGKAAMAEMEVALAEHSKTGGAVRKLKKNKQADEYQKQKKVKAIAAQLLDAQRNHQRLLDAVNTDTPFLGRLAAFWVNHFTVSRLRPVIKPVIGFYEPGVIWPNLLGNFADMLIAAELFPAMVHYLNLQTSIGPSSELGKKSGKGINENLGREILELHTLGAGGGYTQADVTALAMIMTGWHVAMDRGRTVFSRKRAEPGDKTLLGRTFGGDGKRKEQGSQFHDALRMLAAHPATAKHIGRKLALHFIGPGSDAEAAKLASVFAANNGELKPVYETLLDVGDGKPFGLQMRNDYQFVISALRGTKLKAGALELAPIGKGRRMDNLLTLGAMDKLTQGIWSAPTPQGWTDDPEFWLSPSVLSRRLEWIPELIKQIDAAEPTEVVARALGPMASKNTLQTIKFASNRLEGMGLVFASPEFNRR